MSVPSEALSSPSRPLPVVIGALFSLLIGVLAFVLAVLGLLGKGGHSDILTALPNLITGIASVASAVGFWRLKRWAIPVNLVAVIGHIVSHVMLYYAHTAVISPSPVQGISPERHFAPGQILSLALVPVLAIIVLLSMEQQRRKGVLR